MLIDVLKDYWVLFVLGLILILVARMIFQAVFKIVLIAVALGFIAIFVFGQSPDDVLDTGKKAVGTVSNTFKETVAPVLEKEAKSAETTFNADGTYEVKTEHVRIVGKKGDPTATVYYGSLSYQVNIQDFSDTIRNQIESAQKREP
jgi:hypothetical protein